jgi:two-component system sensor histidine kinase ChvG
MARVEEAPVLTGAISKRPSSLWRLFHSVVGKFILMLIVFVTVPVMLYTEFRQADHDRQTLILKSVREQGRIIAESLRPLIEREGPSPLPELNREVKRYATAQSGVKVLFRPAEEARAQAFYFVAAEPTLAAAELAVERDSLVERGVFDNLVQSCQVESPIALRHQRPSGKEELLTSITAITTKAGCWAIITTHSTGAFLGTSIGQPYWKTLEVRLAAIIYLAMAALTIGLFVSIWRGLMNFRDLARDIRIGRLEGANFSVRNKVPELALVAEEFDRMTSSLQNSADSIRLAAEDNAHAFKTPIAIMRQSLEPLKRIVPSDNPRGQRALDVIEESVDRLDHLVSSARRLDQATAELLDPPRHAVDLSQLVERMLAAYVNTFDSRSIVLETRIEKGVIVRAGEDLLETVIENVIDNAIEASPRGTTVIVELHREQSWGRLVVSDRGPGVPSGDLDRIFERYVSLRPQQLAPPASSVVSGKKRTSSPDSEDHSPHLGIGLWIVRRNLQAIGGHVQAENRKDGGLSMILRLPIAA